MVVEASLLTKETRSASGFFTRNCTMLPFSIQGEMRQTLARSLLR